MEALSRGHARGGTSRSGRRLLPQWKLDGRVLPERRLGSITGILWGGQGIVVPEDSISIGRVDDDAVRSRQRVLRITPGHTRVIDSLMQPPSRRVDLGCWQAVLPPEFPPGLVWSVIVTGWCGLDRRITSSRDAWVCLALLAARGTADSRNSAGLVVGRADGLITPRALQRGCHPAIGGFRPFELKLLGHGFPLSGGHRVGLPGAVNARRPCGPGKSHAIPSRRVATADSCLPSC